MKVLSLTEPYATLIKKGVKTTVCNSGCGQVIEAGVWDIMPVDCNQVKPNKSHGG